ncbi:hypothetical protein Tco_0546537 [Tanacetum coccineum]
MDSVKPRVLAPGRYAIDVEPIPLHNRNNQEVHLDYLKHLKKSVETLREIVKEAKVERPLDRSLAFACLYTKYSQELLEYVIGTCPKDFNKQDKKHASTPLTKKKQVTFKEQLNICTDASGSQPRSNTKKNRILLAKSVNKKKVKEHPRTNKSSLKTTNHVDSSISSKRTKPMSWNILVRPPTLPETHAIAASMQSAMDSANQQEPNQNWGTNFPNSPS